MSKTVNLQVLLNLASSDLQAQVATFGVETPETNLLRETMVRLATKKRTEDMEAAAGEILALKDNKNEFITRNSLAIMGLQKQIDNLKALNAEAQRADLYGDHEQNYLPLAKLISGSTAVGADKELSNIPKDWTAPVAAAAAPAAQA